MLASADVCCAVALTWVVLQELVRANVPHLHGVVGAGRCDAGAAGVEVSVIHISETKAQSCSDCAPALWVCVRERERE